MAEKMRSADTLLSIIMEDPEKLKALKKDPALALPKIIKEAKQQTPAYFSDRLIYRMVIGALGLVLLIAAVGSIILVGGGKGTPDVLVALGSAAIGALAGLLAPSPTGK